jgi:pSer/pThr/pTyr-binding forkhead associated (FHA) protein
MRLVQIHPSSDREIELPGIPGPMVIVGAAPIADVRLPSTSEHKIAHQHFGVRWTDQLYLVDLGTHEGTILNGVAVRASTPIVAGDRIQAGGYEFEVVESRTK